MIAQDIASSTLTTASVLYPLAIVALGALVKWWMRGVERSVEESVRAVAELVKTVGGVQQEVARLDERLKQLRSDHDRLHSWKNEFVDSIGRDK